MELSERYIQTLEQEGYSSVEELQDKPDSDYADCLYASKVSFCLTDGLITITLPTGPIELIAPTRFDIPANTPFTAKVGPLGAIYIFGVK